MKEIRVNEYYDLFDVKWNSGEGENQLINNDGLYNSIEQTYTTNPFVGFNNFEQTNPLSSVSNLGVNYNSAANTGTAHDLIRIVGKSNASHALNSLSIDDEGNIFCYPPPCFGVSHWDKIIFRNFDFTVQPKYNSTYKKLLDENYTYSYENDPQLIVDDNNNRIPLPEYTTGDNGITYKLWDTNQSTNTHINANYKVDWTADHITGAFSRIHDYSNVPLFLKFDNYQSRSKVIFSGCDKTRNPDIEFNFGYEHGINEPIKLNLTLSASVFIREGVNTYNQHLNKDEIEKLLTKCYWCVEWISKIHTNL